MLGILFVVLAVATRQAEIKPNDTVVVAEPFYSDNGSRIQRVRVVKINTLKDTYQIRYICHPIDDSGKELPDVLKLTPCDILSKE